MEALQRILAGGQGGRPRGRTSRVSGSCVLGGVSAMYEKETSSVDNDDEEMVPAKKLK